MVIQPGTHGCKVVSGVLQDRYSATAIQLPTATGADVDHVVSLSNAWQTGAIGWDADRRRRFANDPLNLVTTTATLNAQKGDGDAATWLPPAKSVRCAYVARQLAVKQRYGLWVTPPERSAMSAILSGCPGQRPPSGTDRAPRASWTVKPPAS